MYKEFNFLLGKTLASVVANDREILFTTTKGKSYKLYHEQECCEDVYIESVVGGLQDLVGNPILLAEAAESNDPLASESGTWTFYKLATIKGYVDIRFHGESNGCYSESVSFVKV
jgi:hypothetical protein